MLALDLNSDATAARQSAQCERAYKTARRYSAASRTITSL